MFGRIRRHHCKRTAELEVALPVVRMYLKRNVLYLKVSFVSSRSIFLGVQNRFLFTSLSLSLSLSLSRETTRETTRNVVLMGSPKEALST